MSSSNPSKHILLVEDDEIDKECVIRLIKKHDIKVTLSFAQNGLEAIEILKGEKQVSGSLNTLPDLILLDINIPKMNGIEVLEALSNQEFIRPLNIVMLTTSDRDQDKISSSLYPIKTYLTKPITLDKLESLLSDQCDE